MNFKLVFCFVVAASFANASAFAESPVQSVLEPCSWDSSCMGDGVCVAYTFESCPDSDVADSSCEVQSLAYCVPSYVAPCESDFDCGAGFTCTAAEQCFCPEDSADAECICKPTDENSCRIMITACESDVDCVSGMNCVGLGGDSFCEPPGFSDWAGTPAEVVAEESGMTGELVREERMWADVLDCGTPPEEEAGCSTASGDASLSVVALLGLIGLFRRR